MRQNTIRWNEDRVLPWWLRTGWAVALWLTVCLLAGCGPKELPHRGVVPLGPEKTRELIRSVDVARQNLASWSDMAGPVHRSLAYLQDQIGTQPVGSELGLGLTVYDLKETLHHLLQVLPRLDADPGLLAREFTFYEIRPGILFTGYYEPELAASLKKRPGYPYPLYAPPPDLHGVDLGRFHSRWEGQRLMYRIEDGKVVPYYTRAQIDGQRVLRGKADVVAWAKDPVDAFFLQIQGSGRLRLPDGRTRHIGYAGKNGRPYVSLGRVLVQRGYMDYDGLSMQSIRAFLEDHSDLLPSILFTNPSYVFFRLQKDGPYGAMGQKLTPMVSVATDPSLLPLGSLLLMQVDVPHKQEQHPLSGLGLAQDVGGAIQGRHVDLYCGTGSGAGRVAGRLKATGRVCLMLSQTVHTVQAGGKGSAGAGS